MHANFTVYHIGILHHHLQQISSFNVKPFNTPTALCYGPFEELNFTQTSMIVEEKTIPEYLHKIW
ncbi:hypothetical protein Mapa_010968 [Marchantia paleacea]|nr:hypothetical protein Mapa_010968 [Marchantia paleacea]